MSSNEYDIGTASVFITHHAELRMKQRKVSLQAVLSDITDCISKLQRIERGRFQIFNMRMMRTVCGAVTTHGNEISILTVIDDIQTPNFIETTSFVFSKSIVPNQEYADFQDFKRCFISKVKSTNAIKLPSVKAKSGLSDNTIIALLDVTKLKNNDKTHFVISNDELRIIIKELQSMKASKWDLITTLRISEEEFDNILNGQSIEVNEKEDELTLDSIKHLLEERMER